MGLHVNAAAQQQVTKIMKDLRSARLKAGISQNALAEGLPFRGRAISEWETGAIEPTLGHLILLARELGQRLVILGPDGQLRGGPLRERPGEERDVFERRRLASPLRNRRQALGMSQGKLSELVGVTRDSIQRWELVRVPPRPIAHAVWAQNLGCAIVVRPIDSLGGARANTRVRGPGGIGQRPIGGVAIGGTGPVRQPVPSSCRQCPGFRI